jgi:hypothetical protein
LSTCARSSTLFPAPIRKLCQSAADVLAVPIGLRLAPDSPPHGALAVYLNMTGTESGYSYFAPNVPDNYKLVFQLQYRDGRTEDELPEVSGRATGLRLATLLDEIAETEYEPLRAMLVKMLAYAVWQRHQDAIRIHAVFGYVELPTMAEFRAGKKESYNFWFGYNFNFERAQQKLQ